jgi:hypothetical protein
MHREARRDVEDPKEQAMKRTLLALAALFGMSACYCGPAYYRHPGYGYGYGYGHHGGYYGHYGHRRW